MIYPPATCIYIYLKKQKDRQSVPALKELALLQRTHFPLLIHTWAAMALIMILYVSAPYIFITSKKQPAGQLVYVSGNVCMIAANASFLSDILV